VEHSGGQSEIDANFRDVAETVLVVLMVDDERWTMMTPSKHLWLSNDRPSLLLLLLLEMVVEG
jgi:hypothetical protein